MKLLILTIIYMTSISVIAQEPPAITYEAQIFWILDAGSEWKDIPITYSVIAGAVTETHKYWSMLGVQKFVASACDSTVALPKKVVFQFEINTLPDPMIFITKYQVRLRGRAGNTVSEWSESSDWIGIVNILPTGKVIHYE